MVITGTQKMRAQWQNCLLESCPKFWKERKNIYNEHVGGSRFTSEFTQNVTDLDNFGVKLKGFVSFFQFSQKPLMH